MGLWYYIHSHHDSIKRKTKQKQAIYFEASLTIAIYTISLCIFQHRHLHLIIVHFCSFPAKIKKFIISARRDWIKYLYLVPFCMAETNTNNNKQASTCRICRVELWTGLNFSTRPVLMIGLAHCKKLECRPGPFEFQTGPARCSPTVSCK